MKEILQCLCVLIIGIGFIFIYIKYFIKSGERKNALIAIVAGGLLALIIGGYLCNLIMDAGIKIIFIILSGAICAFALWKMIDSWLK